MKISSLEELRYYVSKEKITSPKFEISDGQVILIPSFANFNIIITTILLPFIIILIQKTENVVAIMSIALLVLFLYFLWYDFNAINKVEINLDKDQVLVKYRSPFRLLLYFMDKHRQRSFSISSLNGFFYKETTQKVERFRLYAERKDVPDVLLIDFSSEEHAAKVADYLNKAMKEAAKKAQTLR